MLSRVVQYLEKQDAELVRSQLSDGHPLAGTLEDAGFVARPSESWLSLSVASAAVGVNQAWLLRRENHMITRGDLMF